MNKDCGFYTAKYILCFFNFIFLIIGTIVLAIGTWLCIDKASLIALLKIVESENLNDFTEPAVIEQSGYFLLGLGAILFVLSFLGYFGAMRESRCLLVLYGILSLLILCIEFVAIGLGFFYKEEASEHTKEFLRDSIVTYYSSNEQTDVVTSMWNKLMSSFSCCGVDNYNDLEKSTGWMKYKGNRTIPEACCVLQTDTDLIPQDSDCVINPNENNSYYNVGCYQILTDWLLNHRDIIIGVLLGVDVAILFGAFFAFYLCKSVRRIHRLRL